MYNKPSASSYPQRERSNQERRNPVQEQQESDHTRPAQPPSYQHFGYQAGVPQQGAQWGVPMYDPRYAGFPMVQHQPFPFMPYIYIAPVLNNSSASQLNIQGPIVAPTEPQYAIDLKRNQGITAQLCPFFKVCAESGEVMVSPEKYDAQIHGEPNTIRVEKCPGTKPRWMSDLSHELAKGISAAQKTLQKDEGFVIYDTCSFIDYVFLDLDIDYSHEYSGYTPAVTANTVQELGLSLKQTECFGFKVINLESKELEERVRLCAMCVSAGDDDVVTDAKIMLTSMLVAIATNTPTALTTRNMYFVRSKNEMLKALGMHSPLLEIVSTADKFKACKSETKTLTSHPSFMNTLRRKLCTYTISNPEQAKKAARKFLKDFEKLINNRH